jgi:peptidoglycan/LPS O-acetylase OafA/YrhL
MPLRSFFRNSPALSFVYPGRLRTEQLSQPVTSQKSSKYFENLDSLRTLAFLAVFLCHCIAVPNVIPQTGFVWRALNTFCYNGARGVQVFFVISGFIITYLLVSEKERTGNISLRNFYIRRTLRIWPLFYLIITYVFLIKPALSHFFGIHWQFSFSDAYLNNRANPWLWSLFLGNFNIIFNGPPPSSELHLLWSLCVEEQFYLFWPIILKFTKINRIPYVLMTGIVISVFFRVLFSVRFKMLESNFNTLILLDFFAAGGLLAYLINMKEAAVRNFMNTRFRRSYELVLFGMILFLMSFDTYTNTGIFEVCFKYTFYAIAFALVLMCVEFKTNSMAWLKANPVLRYLGKRSYGLYMYHMVMWTIIWSVLGQSNIKLVVILSLLATIGVSILSYKYFESPFLQIAKRFRRV